MEILITALNVIKELLPQLPNYEQRKKEKFYRLLEDYENEVKSENRDDLVVDNLRDDIMRFLKVFRSEIQR